MIIMLAVVLAGGAGWLWVPFADPTGRVQRALRPWSRPHMGPRPHTGSPTGSRTAGTRPDGQAFLFSPSEASPGGPQEGRGGPAEGRRWPGRRETTFCAVAGLAIFLVVGGVTGALAGAAGSVIAWVTVRRREPPRVRREREQVTADLPVAADLMVACLRAGQSIVMAVDITAEAIGGPLGERLAWVSGQLRLGAAPENAWLALAAERPLAQLARTMSRAALSGAPVADVLTRLSDDARHAGRALSAAAARRVGVQVVAPLGLCFLPAFVVLGIVPVVAVLAGDVLLP
ncbi:membrane protein [Streptosporangium violaceochromogenes]|nr:membrane protein [Streptosporangium violaceochromogenes]